MMRNAKNATDRKPLEDRVEQEWDKVKEGKDLVALENFVKTFGPYFAGRHVCTVVAELTLPWNASESATSKASNGPTSSAHRRKAVWSANGERSDRS